MFEIIFAVKETEIFVYFFFMYIFYMLKTALLLLCMCSGNMHNFDCFIMFLNTPPFGSCMVSHLNLKASSR